MAQKKTEAAAAKCPAKTTQVSITQAFTNATQYEKDSRRWKEITDAISYYIAKNMAPIATVERSGFKHLVKTLDRRYTVPSRPHFSQTALPNMYKTCRNKVAAELKFVKHFAATSDLWSSRTMDPYLSLTLHYIDDEWKLRNRCLETAYFPADHTSEMIAQGLRDMLSAWELAEDNLVAITTDNGANIVKAAQLNGWTRQQCFGHRLHLAIGKCTSAFIFIFLYVMLMSICFYMTCLFSFSVLMFLSISLHVFKCCQYKINTDNNKLTKGYIESLELEKMLYKC